VTVTGHWPAHDHSGSAADAPVLYHSGRGGFGLAVAHRLGTLVVSRMVGVRPPGQQKRSQWPIAGGGDPLSHGRDLPEWTVLVAIEWSWQATATRELGQTLGVNLEEFAQPILMDYVEKRWASHQAQFSLPQGILGLTKMACVVSDWYSRHPRQRPCTCGPR
jgi:hypothetical protein